MTAAAKVGAPFDTVIGDATGLAIPAHEDALRAAGADFLTRAFHAFGTLDPANRVTRVVDVTHCPGGSTGSKCFLTVEYADDRVGLPRALFVKFSRDFADAQRDNRGKFEMEGEVRLAELSRQAAFPVRIPRPLFADYQRASHTGVLITEQVRFGEGAIAPHHGKCLDYRIDDAPAHYRAIIAALAQLAAAHRSGRLGDAVEQRFPWTPETSGESLAIPLTEAELRSKVAAFADFVARAPQLFPRRLRDPAFFARLAEEAVPFVREQAAIARFLRSDPNVVALCHWNAHIDNAFFTRAADGSLSCGLMDWGHAGQMNLGFALWGCLSGAELSTWDDHFDGLLALFLAELAQDGGPTLAPADLRLHFDLYVAVMTLSYFLDSPTRIVQRLPEACDQPDRRSAAFVACETARNQLQIATVALNLWQNHDLGGSIGRMLSRG